MDQQLQQIKKLEKELSVLKDLVKLLSERRITQTMVLPYAIKRRHLEDKVIVFGDDRPTNGEDVGVYAYFATDSGVLSLWDGDSWLTTTLS